MNKVLFPLVLIAVFAISMSFTSAEAQDAPPETPALTLASFTDIRIALFWGAVDNTDTYTLTRIVGTETLEIPDIAGTSYNDDSLEPKTNYKYTITATNAIGTSADSNEVTATTSAATTITYAPGQTAIDANSFDVYVVPSLDQVFVEFDPRNLGTYSVTLDGVIGTRTIIPDILDDRVVITLDYVDSYVGNAVLSFDSEEVVRQTVTRETTVTIGVLVPQTGSLGFFGEHEEFAIEKALVDFNAYLSDKSADWRLVLDIRDTASDAATSLVEAQSLIDEGIQFISGPARSASVDAIKTYIDGPPVIDLSLVSQSSTAPELAVVDSIYRLVPSDAKHGPVIANLMYNSGKTVAIPVYVNDPFGRGLANSTVETFEGLGGTAIYQEQTDPDAIYASNGILSYADCPDPDDGTCNGQFTDLVSDLNDIVLEQIRSNGADRIFVLYVGFHSPDFIAEAMKYPALRLVQWVGSDADVQKPELVDNKDIAEFLTDTNFRSCTFEFESDTERFRSLETALDNEFPDDTPLKYVYSAYDSIWAIGLAIDAAGGVGYTYGQVDLEKAINDNDDGALGDVTLDEFGDLDAANFGVFGIEDSNWVRIGTYYPDNTFVITYDDDSNIINVGVLLDLDNHFFYEDDFAVTMALAAQNFDDADIQLHTINIGNGTLPALNALYFDTYDDFYRSSLIEVIDIAIAGYDADAGTFSIDNSTTIDPYPFVIDKDGILIAHGTNDNLVGQNANDLVGNSDRDFASAYDILDSGAPELWWQYTFDNTVTGTDGIKRSLLVLHEPSGHIIGAGYNPPIGDAGHKPLLVEVIDAAIATYDANSADDKFAGITGSFDSDSELFYPFVIHSTSLDIVANAKYPSLVGVNSLDVSTPDRSPEEILSELESVGSTGTWVSYTIDDPVTGLEQTRRAWFVLHDGFVFASPYVIDEKIKYFAGVTFSSSVAQAKPFFDSTDAILISPSSVATSLAVTDNIYRLVPDLSNEKNALTEILDSDEKTELLIFYTDDEWGRDYRDSFPDNTNVQALTKEQDYSVAVANMEGFYTALTAGTDPPADAEIAVLLIGLNSHFISLADNIEADSVLGNLKWYTSGAIGYDPTILENSKALEFARKVSFTSVIFGIESNILSLELQDALKPFGVNYHSYHNSAHDSVKLFGDLVTKHSDDFALIKGDLDDPATSYDGTLGQYSLNIFGDLDAPDAYYTISVSDTGDPSWVRTDKTVFGIGAIVPETGRQDDAGDHRKYATFVAVSDFNGYLIENNADWRLSIDVRDSQKNPNVILAEAEDLYSNGISFISGPSISSGLEKIKTDLIEGQSADLSLVSCCSTAPSLAEIDNIFRLAPSDLQHGLVIANLLYADGKRQLIPLHIDDPFGIGFAESTSTKFADLGGTVDDTARTYAFCADKSDITCQGQFPDLVSGLADAVSASTFGSDEIAILYVGFELEHIVRESLQYPALRTVSWIGSDAQVLSSSLVDDPEIKQFLVDVDFTSCIFDADPASPKYIGLYTNLQSKFPNDTPNVYAYSSYDTIWAIGLAVDAAGTDASLDSIASGIPGVVQRNYGALGDISLDEFGDLAAANYAVWGIVETGWERLGTYYADVGFDSTDLSCSINLESPAINFGKADADSLLSAVKEQIITNTSVKTIDKLFVFPSDSLGNPIDSPVIEVLIGDTFERLDSKKELGENLAPLETITIKYRMNFEHAESLLTPDTLVTQNIAYQAICTDG